jgi:hypothetical protein
MSLRVGRGRALGILIAVLATVLGSASTASAETRIGESTSPLTVGHPFPEAKLVKSTASFDTDGILNLAVETLEPPLETIGSGEPGEPNDTTLQADAFHAGAGGCTVEAIFPPGAHGGTLSPPAAGVFSKYSEPTALGTLLLGEGAPIVLGDAGKVVSGATTSFSISSPEIANLPLDCVVAAVTGPETEGGPLTTLSAMVFPIAVPPPASPVPTPTPSSPPAASSGPTAPPTAPALSIARPKPLKLALEEWKTVKVKVINTGTGDSRSGSLRVRAPKGVAVKPERQQLPALAPGTSWTGSFRVKLTEEAKKKALALTASASGVTGTARLVLKLKP